MYVIFVLTLNQVSTYPGQGFALENFTYDSYGTSTAIYQNAKKLQFRGMTVYVLFLHPYQVYECKSVICCTSMWAGFLVFTVACAVTNMQVTEMASVGSYLRS
jgi:hypothetical protein